MRLGVGGGAERAGAEEAGPGEGEAGGADGHQPRRHAAAMDAGLLCTIRSTAQREACVRDRGTPSERLCPSTTTYI